MDNFTVQSDQSYIWLGGSDSGATPMDRITPRSGLGGAIYEQLTATRTSHKPLRAIKDDIDQKKERGESNLEEVTNEATLWLQSVGVLLDDEQVKDFLNEDLRRAKDQCCFRLISCNWYHRYEMSQVAKSKADEMQKKVADRPQDPVTVPKRAMDLDPISSQHSNGLDSRAMVEKRILELLKDDEVDAVGLCGMGGVDKTTMAENIKNKGAKDMFDSISMVEISQVVNIKCIQDDIALSIGLSFDGKESPKQRATKLHNALKQVKPKRGESYQQTKILIIMDNIWEVLKLDEVGIPHERTSQFYCKILFTSRERSVCKSMGVREGNIVDVNLLGEDESRSLFWKKIRNVDPTEVDKSLVDRLLRSCGGLPRAIETLAKSLSGQKVSTWPDFADELEKPISCRSDDVHHGGTYKIIEASYKFIGNKEKKVFFLLACLYPFGSSIPIEELMRYGIGLKLFRHVGSVVDVIKQANRWTNDLISSSLLLESDDNKKGRHVKVHDIVRSYTILCAEKLDGHKLMVGAIPWEFDESWKKCIAMSLENDSDASRLRGMQFDMLETLLLSPIMGAKLDDDLFMRMAKLKVLVLPQLGSGLPKSIRNLSHLRTLHLQDCILRDEDIELICELMELVVLSLRQSRFKRLPYGMMKLSNLRLLDLNECDYLETIPVNVLGSLTQLEGLYMLESYGSKWQDNNSEIEQCATASIAELRSLCRLKVLEIQVTRMQQITSDTMEFIITNRHKTIFYANRYWRGKFDADEKGIMFSSDDFEVVIGSSWDWLWRYPCLKTLLSKSNCITISKFSYDEGPKNLVPSLDGEGFRILKELRLYSLGVKKICDGQVPPQMFSNLRHLELFDLDNLESYVLPIDVAPNLATLDVRRCSKLKYIWMEHVAPSTQKEGPKTYELFSLKVLRFGDLPNLLQALGNDYNDKYSPLVDMNKHQALLNTNKMKFPSLEELEIYGIDMCKWDFHPKQIGHSYRFSNLRKLHIVGPNNMTSVLGSPSIAATLVQLETLQISFCFKMKQVISEEKEDETEISTDILTFPNLRILELSYLEELECIYGGSYQVCFPTLKRMVLCGNHCMTRFVGPINTDGFSEKVEFKSLEILEIGEDTPVATPNINFYSLFQNLRVLKLWKLKWKHAFSQDMVATDGLIQLNHLEELYIYECNDLEAVVEEIDDGAITPSSSSFNLQFPRLTSIRLENCRKIRWFLSTRHAHIVLDFPSLQQVTTVECNNIDLFSNIQIKAPELQRFGEHNVSKRTMDKDDDINKFVNDIYKTQNRKSAESTSNLPQLGENESAVWKPVHISPSLEAITDEVEVEVEVEAEAEAEVYNISSDSTRAP